MSKIGVIGGSGLYSMPGLPITRSRKITTPFGDPSDNYIFCEFSGKEIVFLPRHGSPHRIPPHKINYRANIWGFKELGLERIISVNAVGGLSLEMSPGMIVIPDQIIDMTKGRESTFYDGEAVHVDFTEPFCPELRDSVLESGKRLGIKLKDGGTYICVSGPRLESRAEINLFSSIGADVVGMTLMPEASLAREAELCFVCIAVVTNYAAGITKKRLTVAEVIETMEGASENVWRLLRLMFDLIPDERKCLCGDALKEARM